MQVNRLHPQAISQLREQTGAGASGEGSWYEGGDDPMDVPNARPRRHREQAPQARSWVDDEYMGVSHPRNGGAAKSYYSSHSVAHRLHEIHIPLCFLLYLNEA